MPVRSVVTATHTIYVVLFLKKYSLKRQAIGDEERPVGCADVVEDTLETNESPVRTIHENVEEQKADIIIG